MYHYSNQQIHHYNPYEQYPIFIDHPKQNDMPSSAHDIQYESVFCTPVITAQPENTNGKQEPHDCVQKAETSSKLVTHKTNVDTSNFSIEQRLIAAVWVHERKITKTSMSQIKHDFRQRFGCEPPAKNTLLVWERKLFSSGSVCDAPRPGRPVHRRSHVEEVVASMRSAPALSLRARALALRMPRTTLRTILHKDLAHTSSKTKNVVQKTAGRQEQRRKVKKQIKNKTQPQALHESGVHPPAAGAGCGPQLHVQPGDTVPTLATHSQAELHRLHS